MNLKIKETLKNKNEVLDYQLFKIQDKKINQDATAFPKNIQEEDIALQKLLSDEINFAMPFYQLYYLFILFFSQIKCGDYWREFLRHARVKITK